MFATNQRLKKMEKPGFYNKKNGVSILLMTVPEMLTL